VAAGVPPTVEAGILPSGKKHSRGGNAHFHQVDGEVALFPPGGTHRLYVSQDGGRYPFRHALMTELETPYVVSYFFNRLLADPFTDRSLPPDKSSPHRWG